jgi:AcrR family transcriptional regulator
MRSIHERIEHDDGEYVQGMTGTTKQVAKRSRTSTRARLLESAYEVFYEQGFGATTVERICTRAGFTRGAFYSNFTTTDELFLALWDQQADRIVESARLLVELLAEIPDPLDVARDALVELELVEPRWFVLNTEFFLHALRHPDVARELSRHRTRLREELGTVLTVMLHAEGRELPAGTDLDLFTRMIIAAHEGCQHQSLVAGHELEPGALQRAMLTLLVTACPPVEGGGDMPR